MPASEKQVIAREGPPVRVTGGATVSVGVRVTARVVASFTILKR